MHKLWSFKNQLSIPAINIVRVHNNLESVKGWKGWRMPGTQLSTLITAGTYIKDGNSMFRDVSYMSKAIIVELKDEEYHKLIIEVENPEKAIAMFT